MTLTLLGKPCKRCISKGDACWQHNTKSAESSLVKISPTKTHGCSNVGKYKGVSPDLFCGPEGGSCPGTYPVNTRKRMKAAISYARYAPYPEGIKSCARKIAKEKGW